MTESAVALAPWIAAQRASLLAQRGHAWLLQGPSGLGQYALGMELVRAWLCDAPTAQGACGRCGSCHAIDVRTHADLCVLMPEVHMLALGWPLSEKAQADIDDKKRKPSREIRVEAMRDAGGHVVQERTVVGDGDDGAFEIHQQAFEPFDRVQIQVVGRLIEQQHIGLGHQSLGQRHALFGTAGQGVDQGVGVQVQALQRLVDALLPVPTVQRLDLALHRVQIAMAQTILFN